MAKRWRRVAASYLIAGFVGSLAMLVIDQGVSYFFYAAPLVVIPLAIATVIWPYWLVSATVQPAGVIAKIGYWFFYVGTGVICYWFLRPRTPKPMTCVTCGYD